VLPTFDGEHLVVDARGTSFSAHRPIVPARGVFVIGAHITAIGTGTARQLLIAAPG
jgi:hypothetical protein